MAVSYPIGVFNVAFFAFHSIINNFIVYWYIILNK